MFHVKHPFLFRSSLRRATPGVWPRCSRTGARSCTRARGPAQASSKPARCSIGRELSACHCSRTRCPACGLRTTPWSSTTTTLCSARAARLPTALRPRWSCGSGAIRCRRRRRSWLPRHVRCRSWSIRWRRGTATRPPTCSCAAGRQSWRGRSGSRTTCRRSTTSLTTCNEPSRGRGSTRTMPRASASRRWTTWRPASKVRSSGGSWSSRRRDHACSRPTP